MSVRISPNDTVWTKNGSPVRVQSQDHQTGKLVLDENFQNVQQNNRFGIKNGLNPTDREVFQSQLSSVEHPDKRQEIEDLYGKLNELKTQKADKRLIAYLEGELKYRIVKEHYVPKQYETDPLSLGV